MKTHRIAASLAVFASLIGIATTAVAQVKDWRKIQFPDMRRFVVPQPDRVELDNGMVIMMLEDHELPLVEILARVRTGSRLDPADKVGLGSVFGQVWRTGGTTSMDGDAIDDYLEARAAIVETGVGTSSAFASVSSLREDFPDVLKVFSDILRNPVFDQDKIDIAVNLEKAGIARRNDDPTEIMEREFARIVYGADSPYARTTEYDTIASITRDDLVAFHGRYVHPDRIILGVRGDFRRDEMVALLKKTFGGWARGPEVTDPEPSWKETPTPGMHSIRKDDMTQSNIIMGHLGIREDNPDIFAVTVLNEAFGGSFAARLFNNVRTKKGLAYRVRGSVGSEWDHPGLFQTFMTTKVETTAAGIDALIEEIEKIVGDQPPTAEEVKRAKDAILESFVFNYDSTGKILAQQVLYEYYGFPTDYLARFRGNIEKVTVEDVARVAKKYIHRDRMAILVVGPAEGLDRPLASFGPVATIDITIPGPSAPSAPAATAESLAKGREILARTVDRFGGAKAVDAVSSVSITSDVTVSAPQGQLTLKVTATFAPPDRIRQELQTPMGEMLMVVNPGGGFMNQMGRQAPLPASQRENLLKGLWRNPLLLAQRRNEETFSVQHVGSGTCGEEPCEELIVTLDGESIRISTTADGRVVKARYTAPGAMGGPPGEHEVTYSDFREVSGLMLPFRSDSLFNGRPQTSTVTQEILINPQVDAALFDSEEAKAAGGGQ